MGRYISIIRNGENKTNREASERDQLMLKILEADETIQGISGQRNISIQEALENGISIPDLNDDLHFQVSQIMIENYYTIITDEIETESLNSIDRIFQLNLPPIIKLLILDNQIEIKGNKIELILPNKTLLSKIQVDCEIEIEDPQFQEIYQTTITETQKLIEKIPQRLHLQIKELLEKNASIAEYRHLENFRNLILYKEGIFKTNYLNQKYEAILSYFNQLDETNIVHEKNPGKIIKECNVYRDFILDFEFKIRNYPTSARAILSELVDKYFGIKLKNYSKLYVILSDITNSTHNFVLENIFGRPNFDCEKAWEFKKHSDLIKHYKNSLIFLISTCQAALTDKEDLSQVEDLYKALQISLPNGAKQILPNIKNTNPLEFDFSFLPKDLNEASNYLMQILREAKPPANEVQWRYLNIVRFLIEGIFFDITNEGHNNPQELEKINANIIAKFKEDQHFHHLGHSEEENTDYFFTRILETPALFKVAGPKSSNSQIRKRAAKETRPNEIQDCHRSTLLLPGKASDYTRENLLNIANEFLSYVANQFGDTTYGESKITISEYKDCIDTEMTGSANQFSVIQFIKVILNAKKRESGLIQRPFEIQIRFADDEIQSHSQYNVKQLKKISRKFLPTYKEAVLNSIHHLSLNKPQNIVEREENEAFIWHLGFVINAVFNYKTGELSDFDTQTLSQETLHTVTSHFTPQTGIEIVSGFIDQDLAYSSNKMPTTNSQKSNTETVRQALHRILTELAEETLAEELRLKLEEYIEIPNFQMEAFHILPSIIDQIYPPTLGLNPS